MILKIIQNSKFKIKTNGKIDRIRIVVEYIYILRFFYNYFDMSKKNNKTIIKRKYDWALKNETQNEKKKIHKREQRLLNREAK